MENARIIKLGPENNMPVTTFEEAFGEYSNLKGRGRERREERKLDRIEKRAEVKAAHQEAKVAKQVGRQEVKQQRQAAKQQTKAAKQSARIERKTTNKSTRQGARIDRKATKTGARVARREMRHPAKPIEQVALPEEQLESSILQDGGGMGQESYQEPAAEPVAYDVPAEESTSSDESSQSTEDTGASDSGSGDEGYTETEDAGTNEDAGEEEGYSEDEYAEDESGFDGDDDYYDETGFDELPPDELVEDDSSFASEANPNGKMLVHPKVQEIADKIEWNKEFVARLNNDRANAEQNGDMSKLSNIDGLIEDRSDRIIVLEEMLSSFCGADGKKSKRRKAHVNAAKRNAKNKIGAIHKNKAAKAHRNNRLKHSRHTNVAGELNPMIKKNYIEIPPADNNFDGADVEIASGQDGAKTTIKVTPPSHKEFNWTGVVIGVAVAGGIIYLANKYDWIGKLTKK